MLDWIGSLRISEQSNARVVLRLSRATQALGLVLAILGAGIAIIAWPSSEWLTLGGAVVAFFGVLLLSLRREMIVDRQAGVLRVAQSAFGIVNRSVVPLFHIRAVVIVARPKKNDTAALPTAARYIAYLDRRVGEAIYLDEAKRCATLLRLAEAIADVAELRLEYEAAAMS